MDVQGIKVVHALPGRVRLKVTRVKGNRDLAQTAQEKLSAVPGIKAVKAEPVTGSVLILYDLAEIAEPQALEPLGAVLADLFPEMGAISLDTWLAALAEPPEPAELPSATGQLAEALGSLNAGVTRFTGGLDLRLLVPLSLLFFGMRSLWSSNKLPVPAWYDFLWFAFSTFVMLNRRVVDKPIMPPEHSETSPG